MNAVSDMDDNESRDDRTAVPRAGLSDVVGALRAMVRRRYLSFLLVAGATLVIAVVVILMMTPRYDSIARVRIDPSRNPLSTARDTNTGLTAESIDTEVSVLSSPELGREVTKKLGLVNDVEFTRRLKTFGAMTPDEKIDAVTEQVLGNLHVGREKLTYIIGVGFESRDPVKAARVANSFAETYIDTRVGARTSTAENQAQWFSQQLARLGSDVQAADARVAQYRAQAGIVQGGTSGTITDQQVAPLSTQLASAQSDAASARSKLAEARRQVAAGGLDAVSEVRTSPVIANLRSQRAEVLRNMGEISARYGPRHPETVKVTQQLSGLDQQINEEAKRALGSLEAEADAAQSRASSLGGSLSSLRGEQAVNTRASVIADGLERDATNKRNAYDKMSQMRMEALQSARNVISNAEIVDRARVSLKPASPNKPALIALAAVIALALGFAVMVMQELLAAGMRTVTDIEDNLKLPLLASIPLVKGRKDARPSDALIDQPASIFGEALRNARTSILGVHSRGRKQVVAITSTLPEEGKTTLTLSLGRILGMSDTRTLIIDCDLRKASLRELTQAPVTVGLVEVLRGDVTIDQAIVSDVVPNVDLLMVTEKLFTAEDMFSDERMAKLLETVRTRYDVVLLDLPPVMGVADARTLAVLADKTVMVVRWGSTPARAADSALGWLRKDGAQMAGAIFNMVDPNSEAVGGLFYSGKYAAYYQ